MTKEQIRERNAKTLVAWTRGEERHPHGTSGHRFIVPVWESKNMWDTSPQGIGSSEWGNAAGMVP